MAEHEATFGERLRHFRLRAGLTQASLAERAGLATAAVAALERGARRSPYPHTLGALAEVLRLSTEERALLAATARSTHAPSRAATGREPRAMTSNLPARRPLIGRELDVQRVRALMDGSSGSVPACRLVTLTGVGGVGKTSLALDVAAALSPEFSDGVWLVELAPLMDAAVVPGAMSAALQLADRAGTPPEEAVVAFLQTRRALLVLDNCEHLIDGCARLAGRILDTCPEVRLLATSREPLLIPGEQQVRVRPLPTPEDTAGASLEDLAANPAVQLFVAHARAAHVDFRLTAETAPTVAQICIRLEGIPLALELAAARVSVLSPHQILDRLHDAFHLLSTRNRAAPTRQQTLRATLDWSYDLLTPRERAVFRRLGVFAGGWMLDAAEAVCGLHDVEPAEVLDLIARLVDKSLVVVDTVEDAARHRLREPVRQYALQRLVASGEADAVAQRHAAYYLALAEHVAPELGGPEQITWLAWPDRELDNLRAALHRLAGAGDVELGLRLATALRPYWETRGQLEEGRRWLEHAIARARAEGAPTRLLRDALFGAGRLAQWQANLTSSAALIEESLALSRTLGDHEAIAEALAWLGTVYRRRGAHCQARAALEEALAIGRPLGTSAGYASALTCMGVLLSNQGDVAQARERLEAGLGLFRALGDLRWQAITLVMLGQTALAQQQPAEARTWLVEGLTLLRAIGDTVFALFAIEGLAEADVRAGQLARAARWFGATEVLRDRFGARRALPNWQSWDDMVAILRQQLGDAALTDALAAGRGLGLQEIVAEVTAAVTMALAPENGPEPGTWAGKGLTPRERQVADLLQQGCSDREIAARLSITAGTAGLHVHRVLTKLNLRSRWQVADWLARGACTTATDRPQRRA